MEEINSRAPRTYWQYRARFGACTLYAAICTFAVPALALDTTDALYARTAAGERVRVIVQLADPSASAGDAESDSGALGRRQRAIANAQARVGSLLGSVGTPVTRAYQSLPFVALEADAVAVDVLSHSQDVVAIFEDVAVPPTLDVSAPLVQADQAWNAGYQGSGWAIAVLDSGVDASHPFLGGRWLQRPASRKTGTARTREDLHRNDVRSRRPKLLDAKKVALARLMHADKHVAINDICTTLAIGRTTLYRYLNAPPGRGPNHTEG